MRIFTINCVMAIAALAGNAQASSLIARAECNGGGTLQGQNTAMQVGTPGQTASASIESGCTSSATATFSTFKIGTDTNVFVFPPGPGQQGTWIIGKAVAETTINFGLLDPSLGPNAPGRLNIPIVYDVVLNSGTGIFAGVGSGASLGIKDPYNPFFDIVRLFSGYTNQCPNPASTIPACNGRWSGTAYYGIDVVYNTSGPANRLGLTMTVDSLNGSANALNTITFGNTILPTGASFFYDSEVGTGNPLGFTTETAAGVPEPGTVGMLTAGLLGLAIWRKRR